MKLENFNELLTLFITNDNIKNKNNKNIFAYNIADNSTHTEAFDKFIDETNIDLNNSWYFETAMELTKMGHMILCNIPDTNDVIFFCPDKNIISKTQKIFLSLFNNEFCNFENINVALYDEENDDFIEKTIPGEDFDYQQDILVNKKILIKK